LPPTRSKPHERAKLRASITSTNDAWADEISARLLRDCHPRQRDFVEDDALLISGRVGRGGGKTTGQRARFLRRMTSVHKARCAYATLSRPLAKKLMWAPLKATIQALGIDATFNETELLCTIKRTGSTLFLCGADTTKEIDKLRGQPFDELCIDEIGSMKPKMVEYMIDEVVGPRIGERNGTLVIISTPGHDRSGPFYETTRPGSPEHRPYEDRDKPEFAGWEGWSSHWWSLADPEAQKIPALANLWAAALKKFALKGWDIDHPIRRREYEGIWAEDETDTICKYRPHLEDGTPWNEWDPERIKRADLREIGAIEIARLPPGPDGKPRTDWLYAIALDFGSRDPLACNAFAASPSDPGRFIYHVFTFERTGMTVREIAVLLLGTQVLENLEAAHAKPGGLIGAIGEWPAGLVADIKQLGQMILDELSQVYGIKILPAEQKGKHGAVELVNGDLVEGRLKILKGSPLAQQMTELQWQADKYGFPQFPKGQADHSFDTALYGRRELAAIFETIDTTAATKPSRAARTSKPAEPQPTPEPEAPPDPLFTGSAAPGSFDSLFSDSSANVDWG
jgi:hypothetical protein